MSLTKNLLRAVGASKGSSLPGWVMTGESVFGLSGDGWIDRMAMSTDTAMKISTVSRCVETLSSAMGAMPVFLMWEDTHRRIYKHNLSEILWVRPNENMTPFEYGRVMMSNQVLNGNAYAWIRRDRRSALPVEWLPLEARLVTMMRDDDGTVWYQYADPVSGDLYRIERDDMTHYKGWSMDGVQGSGVLQRAGQTLIVNQDAERYEQAVYRNMGRPGGVLTTEEDLQGRVVNVKDREGRVIRQISGKDSIRAEWERVHRGPDNALRTAVLDRGMKYEPISGMSAADLQLVENKDVRVADICRFFGVPLHLVFAGKQSYASNEQNGIEFVKHTLLGYVRQWDQEDSYKLLLPSQRAQSQRIKRETKVFLQGDTAAQATWLRTMRELGAYNADEVRAMDDRPAIPGGAGTRYTVGPNYMPIEMEKEMEG